MQALTPEQKLEIAQRIHETFELPWDWHQGSWGRDDNGETVEFDGEFYVVDDEDSEVRHPPAWRRTDPDSPLCYCLATAVVRHTCEVLGHDPSLGHNPTLTRDATEAMCALYTELAGIDTSERENDAADFDPHRGALVDWNDADVRTFVDVCTLVCAVVRHLGAEPRGVTLDPQYSRTRSTPHAESHP